MEYTIGQKIDVWVTKYALTQGIHKFTVTIEKMKGGRPSLVLVDKNEGWLPTYYNTSDFVLQEEAALFVAELKRDTEIAKLEKRIEKLRNMQFVVKENHD